jgi:hypothetical protein
MHAKGSGQTQWKSIPFLLDHHGLASCRTQFHMRTMSWAWVSRLFAPCGQVLQCSAWAQTSWAASRLLNRSKIPLQKINADCNCLCISKASRWTLFWASCQPIQFFVILLNIILPSAYRSHKLSLPLGSGTSFCIYSSPFSRVQYVLCIVSYFQKHKIIYRLSR